MYYHCRQDSTQGHGDSIYVGVAYITSAISVRLVIIYRLGLRTFLLLFSAQKTFGGGISVFASFFLSFCT